MEVVATRNTFWKFQHDRTQHAALQRAYKQQVNQTTDTLTLCHVINWNSLRSVSTALRPTRALWNRPEHHRGRLSQNNHARVSSVDRLFQELETRFVESYLESYVSHAAVNKNNADKCTDCNRAHECHDRDPWLLCQVKGLYEQLEP